MNFVCNLPVLSVAKLVYAMAGMLVVAMAFAKVEMLGVASAEALVVQWVA